MFKLGKRNVQLYKPSIQDMVILGNLCVRHKKKQCHQCNLLIKIINVNLDEILDMFLHALR